jgi:DNA-directed RNA polymerase specialized sigma24 family protein
MSNADSGHRPTASVFFDPVVYLLGRHSGFKPYVGVSHEAIRDDALRLAGIDPANSPWPLRDSSSKSKDGLYRRVHFAWRNQCEQHCGNKPSLCGRPIIGGRGTWALTVDGVARARELREKYDGLLILSGPNPTAVYLGENFNKLWGRITLHLRRKMPKSDVLDKVEDHAANWFERVMQRDGLRSRLDQGKPPAPSQACAWARKSAYTDIRNEGREPVCRVFHGALTKPEIPLHDVSNWVERVIPRTINDSDRLSGGRYAEHSEDDDSQGNMIENLADEFSFEDEFADSNAFDHVLSRLSEIIHEELDDEMDPAWHEQVMLDRFVRDMTVREIAEAHGMSDDQRNRVSRAIDKVRDVMQKARDVGEFDEFLTP